MEPTTLTHGSGMITGTLRLLRSTLTGALDQTLSQNCRSAPLPPALYWFIDSTHPESSSWADVTPRGFSSKMSARRSTVTSSTTTLSSTGSFGLGGAGSPSFAATLRSASQCLNCSSYTSYSSWYSFLALFWACQRGARAAFCAGVFLSPGSATTTAKRAALSFHPRLSCTCRLLPMAELSNPRSGTATRSGAQPIDPAASLTNLRQ